MSKRRLLIIIAGCLLLLPLGYGARYAFFLLRPIAPPPAAREVMIPSGSTLLATASILADAGVIASAADFRLLAKQRGEGQKIKAGLYDFSAPATPREILRRLATGDVVKRRVTIVEGMSLAEIAKRIEAAGLGPAPAFLALTRDPAFIAKLQVPATASLEGFLFPETYLFAAGLPQQKIIATMVEEFRRRVTPEMTRAAASRGLDLRKLVTLASIVQKEAGNREEMPLIASVFFNRLQRRMPLQADPTVIYGLSNFNGNLTKRDLQTYTPYNTYKIAGLPPGPIASPGADALRAVAFPASTKYLYFVARGNGSHEFTTNLRDHNAAVRRFQLRRG
jgi:UPF0755 protein